MSRIIETLLDRLHAGSRGESLSLENDLWHLKKFRTGPDEIAVRVGRIDRPLIDSRQVFQIVIGSVDIIERRRSCLAPEVRTVFLAFLVRSAKRFVGSYVASVLQSMAAFEEWCYERHFVGNALGAGDLCSLLPAWAERSHRTRYARAGAVQRAIRWGQEVGGFGYPGVVVPNSKYYQHPTGRIARVGDPKKGAFSLIEFREISKAVHDPAPTSDPEIRLALWLILETAARPVQLKGVRVGDMRKSDIRDACFVRMPRAKGTQSRSHTKTEREISVELGSALEEYVAIRGMAREDWLLPEFRSMNSELRQKAYKRFARQNRCTTLRIPPRSTRWGERAAFLPLTSYRFRYTAATQLAIRGASPEQIASFLDDDTLDMALVYANAASSMVDLLNSTMDEYPLWRSIIRRDFLGKLERGDVSGEAIYAGVSHIAGFVALAKQRLVIGHCQNPKPCDKRPPLDCYRCEWLEAVSEPQPHRSQLYQLLRAADAGPKQGMSDRMAEVMLPWMLAIKDVLTEVESLDPKAVLGGRIGSQEI